MEEKPKVNFQRFRAPKMNRRYLVKFALYVVILVSLWFWYKHQKSEPPKKGNSESEVSPKNIELKDLKIEP